MPLTDLVRAVLTDTPQSVQAITAILREHLTADTKSAERQVRTALHKLAKAGRAKKKGKTDGRPNVMALHRAPHRVDCWVRAEGGRAAEASAPKPERRMAPVERVRALLADGPRSAVSMARELHLDLGHVRTSLRVLGAVREGLSRATRWRLPNKEKPDVHAR